MSSSQQNIVLVLFFFLSPRLQKYSGFAWEVPLSSMSPANNRNTIPGFQEPRAQEWPTTLESGVIPEQVFLGWAVGSVHGSGGRLGPVQAYCA